MLLSPEPDPNFLFLFFKMDGVLLPSLFELTLLVSSKRLLNFTLFVDDETFSSLKFISLIFSVTCKLVALVSNSESECRRGYFSDFMGELSFLIFFSSLSGFLVLFRSGVTCFSLVDSYFFV